MRWIRRVLSLVVVAVTMVVGMFISSPIVMACCESQSPNVQRLLVSLVFVVIAACGALTSGVVAERDDYWYAILQSIVLLLLALVGITFSAVESGKVAIEENLIIALGGLIATWLGHVLARPLHGWSVKKRSR